MPEKGIRYLIQAFKKVETDKKLVIAGESSDTDSFMREYVKLKQIDKLLCHIDNQISELFAPIFRSSIFELMAYFLRPKT